ncbi:MAG: general stress protein [Planococcus donghaensis]
MTHNKFMGTFDSENEVLNKIEELKARGSRENDMYVMARDEDQISLVRGRTDVDYKSSEGNWMDKFMGFLSGDDSTREAFSRLGVDKNEADRYYNEVQNGKILLFVDREFGANYEGEAPYDNTSTSPEAGTMGASAITGAGLGRSHMDNEAVGRDGLTVDTNDENDVYYNTKNDTFSRDTTENENETATGLGADLTDDQHINRNLTDDKLDSESRTDRDRF